LTCGLVVLLAVSCATVGVAAVLTLRGFLTERLDAQLADLSHRLSSIVGRGGDPFRPGAANGAEHLDIRQQLGTFGARLLAGRVTDAVLVRSGTDTPVTLSAADRAVLVTVPVDSRSHDVNLSALGDYHRFMAVSGPAGEVLVAGLPLSGVDAAVRRLEMVGAAVFGGALLAAGVAGGLWVSWSLRPLRRVAATAVSVTELPLASGEVALPSRVPDTDPRSEVGQVGTALNLMLGHVEDALSKRHRSEERLRSFAADASHELRTPVASIRGHAELALRHPGQVPPEVSRALERVAAESGRMSEMVDDLLLLARLDAGRPLERAPVDLTRLLLDGVDDARAVGPDHRWTLDLPEEPVTVPGDKHRMQQVVGNLLANARIHTPEGAKVAVRLRCEDGSAILTVTDDGPGVPDDVRSTIFERFTRADRRHRGTGSGSGLGLSIVSAVVAAHGGTVAVDSRPGATRFTVRLPG
jgi:two-component system OmpR family sensor kinase